MDTKFWDRPEVNLSRKKAYLYAAVWIASGLVGIIAVLYARFISHLQFHYFGTFNDHPYLVSLLGPFLFLMATAVVKKLAPDAKGSGIPQVLAAIDLAKHQKEPDGAWGSSLVSLKTSVVKVISSAIGILGGASIGREGPTVQLAATGFAWVGKKVRSVAPEIDFQSFLIAGAAAGVSAAFNTPIAGIAFALEEIADGIFGPFRQLIMLAVILAGITSQGFSGNYLYFGQPVIIKSSFSLLIPEALILGVIGGLLGGLLARFLAYPQMSRLPGHWALRAFVCGALCSVIGYLTHGATAGSGYEAAKAVLESDNMNSAYYAFPLLKFATTILSYLSGMAGGIFSPCLSIGAGLGVTLAKLAHFANFKSCALIGMVAFFSGAVRAPLTGVIIVMEMTDEHTLVLPFMIAAFIAFSLGKRVMPTPLYHFLAQRFLDREQL